MHLVDCPQLLSLDSPISVKLDVPSFTELFKEYSAAIDAEIERLKVCLLNS